MRFRADEAASYELGVKVRRALAEHPGPHPAEVVLVPSGHVYQLGLKVEHDDQLFFKVANLGLETPATSAF